MARRLTAVPECGCYATLGADGTVWFVPMLAGGGMSEEEVSPVDEWGCDEGDIARLKAALVWRGLGALASQWLC